MSERFDTIVIGAGQAGLSAGYPRRRCTQELFLCWPRWGSPLRSTSFPVRCREVSVSELRSLERSPTTRKS